MEYKKPPKQSESHNTNAKHWLNVSSNSNQISAALLISSFDPRTDKSPQSINTGQQSKVANMFSAESVVATQVTHVLLIP